jgi:hypothetical protein
VKQATIGVHVRCCAALLLGSLSFPTHVYADQHGNCARAGVDTPSQTALACSAPGAACNGGAGRCVNKSVKTGPAANKCKCARKGKGSVAVARVAVDPFLVFLNSAPRGESITLEFTREQLLEERTFLFHPELFDATPLMHELALTMEVIGRPGPGLVMVKISGVRILRSFETKLGNTGTNFETISAGMILVNTIRGVFEGLFTVVLVNDIWTADNPMVLVEGVTGQLDPVNNTMSVQAGAPDEAFVVPTRGLSEDTPTTLNRPIGWNTEQHGLASKLLPEANSGADDRCAR